jgi:hypothetical protein
MKKRVGCYDNQPELATWKVELPHIHLDEIDSDACRCRLGASAFQHRSGQIAADRFGWGWCNDDYLDQQLKVLRDWEVSWLSRSGVAWLQPYAG